ncbi:hypothetical protein BN946_scf184857.g36 [Trametes cinnabarina]|uniref:Uncharacterized protein n=1 Tax=Pycnoporus cinnabarinus TaxID=5643 RepID=A0A060SYV3_PYCCI|nr:hypothetical protein BN946_scf184857.g36 [Trametes cinnabarina]
MLPLSEDEGDGRYPTHEPSGDDRDVGEDEHEPYHPPASAPRQPSRPSHTPTLEEQIRHGRGDVVIPHIPPESSAPQTVADQPEGPHPIEISTPIPHPPTVRPTSPSLHPGTIAPRPFSGPGDLHHEQALAQREQELEDLSNRMNEMMEVLEESELKRDENFRANEGDRQKIFETHEQQRFEASKARQDQIWDELERRLATLPPQTEGALPVPPPGVSRPEEHPEEVFGEVPPGEEAEAAKPAEVPQSIIPTAQFDPEMITDAMARAAARHADDIREIVEREREELRREQEEAQAERERAAAEAAAERARMHEEYQAHIRALESELEAVRKELEEEKLARQAEEAERRENERAEMLERDEAMRSQLSDITNIVSEQRDELARKRELADQRWEFKQNRWEQKDAEDAQTRNMLQQILEGQAAMLDAQEKAKADLLEEMRANQRAALDAIEEQRVAYEGTIRDMADAWRADCEQRKQETIEAVKATANEQVPYNVQGYLDEFSRSLATEVRMLLSEVGKLREDKRNLEYQIGELLQFKSKYGPGGEFDPSWKPAMTCVPTDAAQQPEPAPAPEPEPEVPQHAPGAWRPIHLRGSRRSRRTQATAAPPPPPPEPAPQTQSWATWQPNPAFQPTPPPQSVDHLLAPPQGSPGLFGPRSPRDSLHR